MLLSDILLQKATSRVERSIALFWSKVKKLPENECWVWTGKSGARDGRGSFWINGREQVAPRISWQLEVGPIPKGQCVLHRCDNPKCVRPSHLFLGTQKENMEDASRKGRMRRDGNPKLTEVQVEKIRQRLVTGDRGADLAKEFGVSPSAISLIRHHRTWGRAA